MRAVEWTGASVWICGEAVVAGALVRAAGGAEVERHGQPDVALCLGAAALSETVSLVEPHVPICLVLEGSEVSGREVLRTAGRLARRVSRINLVILDDLESCRRFARLRLPLAVARHEGQVGHLASWVLRAHAFGPRLPASPDRVV